jgi:hypothetical protein
MIRALLCGLLILLGAAKAGAQCTAVITGPSSFCTGGSATLTASTSTTCTASYQWYYSAAGVTYTTLGSSSSSNTLVATAAGYYKVDITYGGTCGCTVTSSSVQITINPLPPASITPSGTVTICSGGSAYLTSGIIFNISYIYQWYLNGFPIGAGTSSSYFATTAGRYSFFVVDYANGCTNTSNTDTVVVNPQPPALITPSGTISVCPGSGITLSASVGTGLTYQWFLGTTSIAGSSPTFTTGTAGTYTVLVSNTSSGCTRTSNTDTLVILPPDPAPTTTPVTYCQGATALPLTAVGGNLQWWLTPTSPIPLSSFGVTPSTTTPGTTTYWVSQTVQCTSPRSPPAGEDNSHPGHTRSIRQYPRMRWRHLVPRSHILSSCPYLQLDRA